MDENRDLNQGNSTIEKQKQKNANKIAKELRESRSFKSAKSKKSKKQDSNSSGEMTTKNTKDESSYLFEIQSQNNFVPLQVLDDPNFYQSFIRYMTREDTFKKLLIYMVSEPFNHGVNAGFFAKLRNHLHFLCRTAGLPQLSELTLRRIAISEAFADSLGVLTEKVWPTVLAGLLLHDGITYFTQPLDRYGNRLVDIMGGISPNQLAWSSHLGGDLPDTILFGLPLLAPLYLFLASSLYIGIPKHRWKWEEYKKPLLINESIKIDGSSSEDDIKLDIVQGVSHPSTLTGDFEQRLFAMLWDKKLSYQQRLGELKRIENQAKTGSWLERFSAILALAKIVDSFDESSLLLADINAQSGLDEFNNLRAQAFLILREQMNDFNLQYLPQYVYSQYQLWSLGRSESIPAHLIFSPLVFMPFYLLYSKARLVEMFVQKIIQLYEYFKAQKACDEQNKTFVYMPQFGNYECTVCGDSPNVYYNDVFTSQGCLDGLLSVSRTPAEIFKYLDQILKHPDFTEVDITQQNWTQWSVPQWTLFLDKISNVTHHLNTFNLSSPALNPVFPSDGRIEALGEFLTLVSVDALDLNNNGMGDRIFSVLLEGLQNNSLSYLDISSNQLTTQSALSLSNLMTSNSTLKTLKIAHNPLGDSGIEHIFGEQNGTFSKTQNLTTIDVSDTSFGAGGLQSIGDAISYENSSLEELDISHNDLSVADAGNFGLSVSDSPSLESLSLAGTQFDDDQATSFMESFATKNKENKLNGKNKRSKIKSLDFSHNPLTDQGMFLIINNTQNSTVTAIYFDGNALSDDGMEAISNILKDIPLEKLSFSNAQSFTSQGVEKLLINLPQTTKSLDLSNNRLGDGIADTFLQVFHNDTNCTLKSIDLGGNLLTDDGGQKLVRLFAAQNITELSLDHNGLTDKTVQALAEVFPESQFVALDLSYNQIEDDTGLSHVASTLPGSHLEKLSLSNNKIGNQAALAVAETLVTHTPHNNSDIGKVDISRDEMLALRKTKPNTQLTEINLSNNQIGEEGERGFCRILPNTKISRKNLRLDNNPGNINFNDCETSSTASRPRPFEFFKRSEIHLPDSPVFLAQPEASSTPALTDGIIPQSNNNNASLYMGAALIPGVILSLIALYLIYRALKPAYDNLFENRNTFFTHFSNSAPDNQTSQTKNTRLQDDIDLEMNADSDSETFSM